MINLGQGVITYNYERRLQELLGGIIVVQFKFVLAYLEQTERKKIYISMNSRLSDILIGL